MVDTTSRDRAPDLHYPFELVPGDDEFTFPGAEGVHPDCQSDTWFLAGELTGTTSGRRFAFLTIFNQNRPGGDLVADFHTMALFDLDHATYGTFTDYDMPPKNMAPGTVHKMSAATGHLEMSFDSRAGRSLWTARRGADDELVPFSYDVTLAGVDQADAAMELRLEVSPTRAPVPVGADTYNGRFSCLAQPETFSYFQTGMAMTGTLKWGNVFEEVSGTSGHIDRQWFPLPAGGGGTGGDPRAISYEWRTIHLDNGTDVVAWRQFDRRDHNSPRPFTGATVAYAAPERAPECVEDIEVRTESYVRWPESVRQLMRPPVSARYMPERHTFASKTLDLEISGVPLVAAPAHTLPVEYMEGPFLFEGTMRGEPVRGFGISERSLALYRDWELVDVLATTHLAALADTLRPLIADGRRADALDQLRRADPGEHAQLVDDLAAALAVNE
ncbi:secreted hydrolase [Mycolicibacterium sp.]|uniref:secreted hydrolase n=1 Tax=Mycolicibacterium sp. TaxID=2320850 RepID=UPI001A28B00B|nr:secreted hydrolase [Mycolicibacterium sp.]MBJ7337468.1 secreted hydrolase [Mycolicibacterium sp.]